MEPENLLENCALIYQDIRCQIPEHYIPETKYCEQGSTNPWLQITVVNCILYRSA